MFAGLAGNAARFAKAMEACERTLAVQPKHPSALVWHGSGLFFQSGRAFQQGDMATGAALWERGLGEMNEAVALAPDDLRVITGSSSCSSCSCSRWPAARSRSARSSRSATFPRRFSTSGSRSRLCYRAVARPASGGSISEVGRAA